MNKELHIKITDVPYSCNVCPFHITDFMQNHKCILIDFMNHCTNEYNGDNVIGCSNDTYLEGVRFKNCPLDKEKINE